MKKLNNYSIFVRFALLLIFSFMLSTDLYSQTVPSPQQGSCLSITSASFTYSQNFDTLGNIENTIYAPSALPTPTPSPAVILPLPPAVVYDETSTNANTIYEAEDGSDNASNTYSFGTGNNTERALGEVTAGTLVSIFGVCFTNNTGETINTIRVGYVGEQWRKGTTTVTDRLDFSYSSNSSSLTSGMYTDENALDFTTPNSMAVGARDGNLSANRTIKNFVSININVSNGNSFILRWVPIDVTDADDGLAIDNLVVTTQTPVSAPVTISGRVVGGGNGLSGAFVTMTDSSGNARTAMTTPFGYYRFYDVPSGDSYIFTIRHKRFAFEPRIISITEELTNLDFSADPAVDDVNADSPTKSENP